jgi:glutamine synthetase adenylyltransferase
MEAIMSASVQPIAQTLSKKAIQQSLNEKLSIAMSDDELASVLRQFRHYHQLRIIWRDLNRLVDSLPPQQVSSWFWRV